MKNRATQIVVTRQLNALMIYTLIVTIALIVVIVRYAKHECPIPDTSEVDHKIEVLNLKQKRYEELINNDSIIVWKSNRPYRDSIRATRLKNYLR